MLKEADLWDEAEMEQKEEQEENNEIKLIEEYHEKLESLNNIVSEKEKLCRILRVENDKLFQKSNEESTLLQEKTLLCEKLKRDVKNLEKENIRLQKKSKLSPSEIHAERMKAARIGRNGYVTQKEQRKDDLQTIMKHGRRVKKHQEWLSKELGNTIENFNEMFISNLSQSLTQIFVDKDKKNQSKPTENSEESEENEEEEEEGEVIGQKTQDEQKSLQVDENIEISDGKEGDESKDEEEEKVDPKATQNIDEAICQNVEAQSKDKEMANQLHEQEKAFIKIEGSLNERERLLTAVKESHSLMQNTLLEEMKKEYFK